MYQNLRDGFRGLTAASFFVIGMVTAGLGQSASAGFIDSDGAQQDDITLDFQTTYTICFGGSTSITNRISQPTVFFLDDEISPADGLRVRITNISDVYSDRKNPYSDREYEDFELGSEKIILAPSNRHRTRTFSIWSRLGETLDNTFAYRIYEKRSERKLKEGTFVVTFDQIELPPITTIEGPGCGINNPPPFPPLPPPPF